MIFSQKNVKSMAFPILSKTSFRPPGLAPEKKKKTGRAPGSMMRVMTERYTVSKRMRSSCFNSSEIEVKSWLCETLTVFSDWSDWCWNHLPKMLQ
jgi:hypothetical protein